jgi:hypothetical protein
LEEWHFTLRELFATASSMSAALLKGTYVDRVELVYPLAVSHVGRAGSV